MQTKVDKDTDVFEQYSGSLEIIGIRVFKKSKKWELQVNVKKPVSLLEIKRLEEKLCKAYELKEVKIFINESTLEVDREQVLRTRWGEVKDLLISNYPAFTGFLKDSVFEVSGSKCLITVPTKLVSDYLHVRKCDQLIEKYIKEYLKIDVTISIKYESECCISEDYYEEFAEQESRLIKETISMTKGAYGKSKNGEDKSGGQDPVDNIILGKNFNDMPIKIDDIREDSGRVSLQGMIIKTEVKNLNNGKTILTFDVTDLTNSITAKLFIKEEAGKEKLIQSIVEGKCIRLKGDVQFDPFQKELVIFPINIVEAVKHKRTDKAEEKRIELHAHTGMSSMDGMCSASALIKRAKEWGHKAIAITDHGVAQAFPEAYETAKKCGIKVLYGIEGYFVNDGVPIVFNPTKAGLEDEFVVFDIETTGLSASKDRITEIGAVKIQKGIVTEVFSELVNPEVAIPENIIKLTGITNEMVASKPTISEVLPSFLKFAGDAPLVAHNAVFDWGFIKANAARLSLTVENAVVDTLQLSRILLNNLKRHKLNILCDHFNISLKNHHRASDDARACAEVFLRFIEMLKAKDIHDIESINKIVTDNFNFKNTEAHHIIILVKNQVGLKNLYKLISMAHLNYFYKKPRILKSLLIQYREGLIIGSACEAGEIYKMVLNNTEESIVTENAKFYDYLEIQPVANNEFLIRNGRVSGFKELENINKKIVELAEKLGKPYVATGDVHFLDPSDEVFRRILMKGQGYSDADEQAPLYLKTTEEMLDEFSYLGKKKAHDAVIQNPGIIAEQIEVITPIPEETFPPIIEGSEEQIRTMTMDKAHEIYGENLPEVVQKRLDKELNSIINNGYAVMYLIAQKLVAKSNSDGYLVGSRGSVGSSFVATMSGITEVNPLPPHYVCTVCKTSEFIMDGTYTSGADLPEKICPKCSTNYKKDGHDIPFEVFLGFEGDKEPDIDLNFAGEYQPEAHKYTEELFGKGYVFRAGTIGTIAEKTAYGYIRKYFEEKNTNLRTAEINRLIRGCSGIKRTTGQHPGGVMIVPSYKDIFEFTPIQRPADDTTSSIITTHFDYHSISGRLLKLDILGHDVPTIIRMLEDITGFKASNIALDEPNTMSLFTSTETMEITLEDIDCKVGSLGIPEFGTKFVRQMLMDTKPTTFGELVRISGLSHGTDVWINNAQDLVRNGTAVLKEVISTRDDIMLYLIYQGLQPKMAFKIMENVRKGKGLTPEYEAAMREKGVPEWYIGSCNTIQYMFPKAHAVAYVMMSFRIAYYKVYYPEAFYATFFTVKIEDFDADLFTKGKEAVRAKWQEIDKKGNDATTKEKNFMILLEVVYEMYLRGVKLLPVDLYKSGANRFMVTPEGILPPLNALQGVGASAAVSIVNAREHSTFMSIDDLRERAKVSKTVIEILKNHGCLQGIPESNQLSLF